ncbi:MAG: phosphatidylglycerol lysyltransferase domain-containing protein [Dysgonamonadaceae bacterium]|jgi:hypothetical protein|nr:phosphatidylglycerol lysyltransferase domain-containing protein [Dysgonamonadaceae bacterium]
MLNFQKITIEDKDKLNRFLSKSTFRNSDFSFSNIYCWSQKYQTSYAIESGFLFLRFMAGGKKAGYMYPLGEGCLKTALETIIADSKERGEPFRMFVLTRRMFENVEAVYPGKLDYNPNPARFEYIYNTEDLIHLTGKKYQSKRNHINKFKKTYRFEYIPITPGIIPECLELYSNWCKENGNCNDPSLVDERISVERAFGNFEKLGLTGGALRVDGTLVAYSYGQPLSVDTFGVHAEKSLYEIDGGFTMINQQFAEQVCSGYTYMNREEDLGLESLRKAKSSYHPAILLEKGVATEKIQP